MGVEEAKRVVGGRSALVLLTIWLFLLIVAWVGVALLMAERGLFYGA